MTDLTRRDAVGIFAGSAIGACVLSDAASADDVADSATTGKPAMKIERIGITPATAGLPVISFASVHAGIVYICGVTADAAKLGDVKDQTRQVLERIDRLLNRAGTDKSKLLTATVWLSDMNLFADHNDAWNEWVDQKNPPARACLLSPQLWRPGMLVEIMATAAI